VNSRFELFIAARYLRARRKEAVISVITAISIVGVAAGVMALIVAMAVNNGFHNTLQRNLLGAMAHINVLEKEPGGGIENWRDLAARLRKLPHVTAVAPALYSPFSSLAPCNPRRRAQGHRPEFRTGHQRHAAPSQIRLARRLRDPAASPQASSSARASSKTPAWCSIRASTWSARRVS